jgi:hypothetical protein
MQVFFAIMNFLCLLLYLPLFPFFWLLCRLEANRCPSCGSKWHTELMGEWGEEDWLCHWCGQYWSVPYGVKESKR